MSVHYSSLSLQDHHILDKMKTVKAELVDAFYHNWLGPINDPSSLICHQSWFC